MHGASATQTKEREAEAAYERWVQSELTGDPRLAALRVLYNDERDYRDVRPETWDYFDLQEMTGGAESMDTQHITILEGEYDPVTDEIVAATAGGERVTYDSFTVSGLERARERAAQNPDFTFQITRDQIYHDNYHGPVKEMWRTQTDYDTVFYGSTFPQDVIDQLGERGRMIIKELAYDDEAKKGFLYGFRKGKDDNMEFFAIRLANATPEFFAGYLQKHGFKAEQFAGVDSHEFGQFVVTANTGDTDIREVAKAQAALFDQAAEELTGERHHYGQLEEGVDAYDLFKRAPNLWKAYRQYHRHLAQHFNGVPMHDDLYDYLTALHTTTGDHVLTDNEQIRLGRQLNNGKITADLALACKKLMTYSHYATLNKKLEDYRATGVITDIDGADIMQAYGGAAGGEGSAAAERGETFNDCDMVYGEQSTTNAAEMADRMGISLEEALRRLSQKPERWSGGECRNCERDTQIWAEADGGCNVCRKCANEHTVWGEQGLEREKRRAQAEREVAERLSVLEAELYETTEELLEETAIPEGTTRYVAGQQQIFMRWVTLGGARHAWVNTATGRPVDDDQA